MDPPRHDPGDRLLRSGARLEPGCRFSLFRATGRRRPCAGRLRGRGGAGSRALLAARGREPLAGGRARPHHRRRARQRARPPAVRRGRGFSPFPLRISIIFRPSIWPTRRSRSGSACCSSTACLASSGNPSPAPTPVGRRRRQEAQAMRKRFLIGAAAVSWRGLSGCTDVKEVLGLHQAVARRIPGLCAGAAQPAAGLQPAAAGAGRAAAPGRHARDQAASAAVRRLHLRLDGRAGAHRRAGRSCRAPPARRRCCRAPAPPASTLRSAIPIEPGDRGARRAEQHLRRQPDLLAEVRPVRRPSSIRRPNSSASRRTRRSASRSPRATRRRSSARSAACSKASSDRTPIWRIGGRRFGSSAGLVASGIVTGSEIRTNDRSATGLRLHGSGRAVVRQRGRAAGRGQDVLAGDLHARQRAAGRRGGEPPRARGDAHGLVPRRARPTRCRARPASPISSST